MFSQPLWSSFGQSSVRLKSFFFLLLGIEEAKLL